MDPQQSTKKTCIRNVMKTLIILQVCCAVINDAVSTFSTYVFPNYIEVKNGSLIDDVYCHGCVSSLFDPHYELNEYTTFKQMFNDCKIEHQKPYVEIYNCSYYYCTDALHSEDPEWRPQSYKTNITPAMAPIIIQLVSLCTSKMELDLIS